MTNVSILIIWFYKRGNVVNAKYSLLIYWSLFYDNWVHILSYRYLIMEEENKSKCYAVRVEQPKNENHINYNIHQRSL